MIQLGKTPISPRQKQVLEIMRNTFGQTMAADSRNYRKIADQIGWKQGSGVRDVLFALRAKGFIESQGSARTRPELWMIVPPR